MDMTSLSPAEQAHLSKVMEKKQVQGFFKIYSNLVERCFNSCCNDFTSKSLSSKEDQCLANCANKFLKHSERVSARFSEHYANVTGSGDNK